MKEEAENVAHKAADSLVVCVASHGDEGYFVTADGERITNEYLTTCFDGRNCWALSGKPKLFIIDACRGGMILCHICRYHSFVIKQNYAN